LPVGLRMWFTKRLIEQIEKENEAMEEASRGGGGGGSKSQTLTPHNNPMNPAFSKKYGQD